MMAPGFKPVGWVAAVAVAAIGCYMLSLNVAAERAELARVEHQIVSTKQQIRALQTELGTRGRLAQLEQWNAEVLALSAPTSAQFLGDEMMLARFDRDAPSIEERAAVRMASAETGPAVGNAAGEAAIVQAAAPVHVAPRAGGALGTPQLVRKASLQLPAAPAPGEGAPILPALQKPSRIVARDGASAKPSPPKISPPKPLVRIARSSEASAPKPSAKLPGRGKPVVTASAGPAREKLIVLASAKPTSLKPAVLKPVASGSSRSPEKPKSGSRIGDSLVREIGAAAKAEARAGGR